MFTRLFTLLACASPLLFASPAQISYSFSAEGSNDMVYTSFTLISQTLGTDLTGVPVSCFVAPPNSNTVCDGADIHQSGSSADIDLAYNQYKNEETQHFFAEIPNANLDQLGTYSFAHAGETDTLTIAQAPEPESWQLLSLGLAGVLACWTRMVKRAN